MITDLIITLLISFGYVVVVAVITFLLTFGYYILTEHEKN